MKRALACTLLILLAASTQATAQETITVIGADLVRETSLIAAPPAGPEPFIQAAPADQLITMTLAQPPDELRLALSEVPFKISIPLIKR
jgi:hypothetical protein